MDESLRPRVAAQPHPLSYRRGEGNLYAENGWTLYRKKRATVLPISEPSGGVEAPISPQRPANCWQDKRLLRLEAVAPRSAATRPERSRKVSPATLLSGFHPAFRSFSAAFGTLSSSSHSNESALAVVSIGASSGMSSATDAPSSANLRAETSTRLSSDPTALL